MTNPRWSFPLVCILVSCGKDRGVSTFLERLDNPDNHDITHNHNSLIKKRTSEVQATEVKTHASRWYEADRQITQTDRRTGQRLPLTLLPHSLPEFGEGGSLTAEVEEAVPPRHASLVVSSLGSERPLHEEHLNLSAASFLENIFLMHH